MTRSIKHIHADEIVSLLNEGDLSEKYPKQQIDNAATVTKTEDQSRVDVNINPEIHSADDSKLNNSFNKMLKKVASPGIEWNAEESRIEIDPKVATGQNVMDLSPVLDNFVEKAVNTLPFEMPEKQETTPKGVASEIIDALKESLPAERFKISVSEDNLDVRIKPDEDMVFNGRSIDELKQVAKFSGQGLAEWNPHEGRIELDVYTLKDEPIEEIKDRLLDELSSGLFKVANDNPPIITEADRPWIDRVEAETVTNNKSR